MKVFIPHRIFLVVLVALLAGCASKEKKYGSNFPVTDLAINKELNCAERPTVTIFIHGTRIFPKFYAQELFYSPEGFNHISAIEEASHMHSIAHALEESDPQKYSYEQFYTFGWNGNLDFQERKKASEGLYKALKELSAVYIGQYGIRPRLRIITHSHGGNVALNLAVVAKEGQDALFFVDELIMLAVPVQQKTKDLVAEPCFGRIYSLSSSNDVVQVIDPQGLYKQNDNVPLFSERYFKAYPHVLQAQIKIQGHFLMHIEFLMEKLFKHLPAIVDIMDTWHSIAQKQSRPIVHIPTIDVHNETIKIYPKLRY